MTFPLSSYATVILYGGPDISPSSTKFSVKINGQNAHVNKTIIGSEYDGHQYVHLAMDEPVTVEVTCTDIPEVIYISPKRFKISHTMTGTKSFKFTITEPHQYIIATKNSMLKGTQYHQEKHNLFLFVDPTENNPPSSGQPGVINVNNYSSISQAISACPTNGTVFVPSGTYTYSSNLIISKSDITLYFAPGAYLKDTSSVPSYGRISIDSKTNVKLTGRGVIDVNGHVEIEDSSDITLDGLIFRNIAVHNEAGRYYWGACVTAKRSKNFIMDNVKVLGIQSHLGSGYPDSTAHDGIRIRSCEDSTVKNSFVTASDDPLSLAAYTGSGVKNVTFKNCVAIEPAGCTYYGGGYNPQNQVINVLYEDIDLFQGAISMTGGSQRNPDFHYKNVTIETGGFKSFIYIGYVPSNGIFSDKLEAVFDNITVVKIFPEDPAYRGLYIRGNSNVNQQNVTFNNLKVSGVLITGSNDLKNLNINNTVIENMNVKFNTQNTVVPVAPANVRIF